MFSKTFKQPNIKTKGFGLGMVGSIFRNDKMTFTKKI